MTTVTITETANTVTVDDENVQVVDVRVVNTATTTSAGLMSASDKSKLDSIESSADVTDATNVEAAGAVMETDTSTTNMQFVVDEDNMASDSATKIPTQQSVKAYVDSQISSKDELSELSGDLDDISDGTNHVKMTNAERTKLTGIETGATADQSDAEIKIAYENNANTNAFTDAEQTKLSGIETGATADQSATEIKSLYESNSDTNSFTDLEQTKLSGIENNATADQSASEIRTLVDSATDSNVFTDADHTKLDGIEANATADQTDAEIKAAYENNSDTNAFTDAEQTKLSGIETNATADQSASEILTAIKTVDGATSGLDADLLDGQEGSYYQQASTALNTTTSFGGDVSGTYDAIVVADDSHNHVISNVDGLQTALDAKAPLASPALTGTPTAPTAAVDDSTTKIATTAFVQQELAQLVDSAPSTLDTLNEIAAAINDDANFNTTVTNSLANRLRVDTDAQGLTSTQQNNAKTNLGLDDVATSGAYSDLTGTPTNATTSTDGLMSSSDKTKLDAVEAGATADQSASEIKTAYESNADTNAFTDAQQTKLAGIEANATADQTDAEIKTAYENNADTNAFTDAEKTKLSNIEANATADQTASEILTLIKTVDGTTSGLDADVLDGQEGSYYLDYNNFTNTPAGGQTPNDSTITLSAGTSLSGGGSFTTNQASNQTITFSHADTSALSGTYGSTSNGTKIDTITLDENGHVTAIQTGATGDISNITVLAGLDGGGTSGSITIGLDLSELDDLTADMTGNDEFIILDASAISNERRKAASEIGLSIFNNDSGFITSVPAQTFASLTGKPTTIAGYGITDAFDGAYSSLTGTPTIPSNTSDLTNDSGFITSVPAQSFASLTGKPTTISGYGITDAFDGAYSSLSGTPTIPTTTSALSNDSGFITSADGGNAQTLDSLDSTQFLRSDAADTKTSGDLTFSDGVKARFGTSGDLQIYHDGSNSFINDVGTGSVVMRTNGSFFQFDTPSTVMAKFIKDGAVELRHNNNLKFSTTSTGIEVTGTVTDDGATHDGDMTLIGGSGSNAVWSKGSAVFNFLDNAKLSFGTGNDLRIWHSGTNSFLRDEGTGVLFVDTNGTGIHFRKDGSETMAKMLTDGAVELYHNNSKKLETTSTGATVTGILTIEHTVPVLRLFDTNNGTDEKNLNISLNSDGDLRFQATNDALGGGGDFAEFRRTGNNITGFALLDNAVDKTFFSTQNGVDNFINNGGNLGIGTDSPSTALEVVGDLTLTSTEDDATENPTLDLYRNSSSPAVNDKLGHINFSGENDADEKIVYGEVEGQTTSAADGNEYGAVNISAMINGTFTQYYSAIFGENRFSRDIRLNTGINLKFEGATNNNNETTLTVTDPTADRTITLPDASGTVLLADGDGSNLTGITANPYDTNTSSTGSFALPVGTTAQQPSATTTEGHIRYDSDDDVVYYSNGTNWLKIAPAIPIISSVTGNIIAGFGTTLTLAGSNFFTSNLTVTFLQASDSVSEDVVVTPASDTSATVTVPAAVYNNVTAENIVSISVTNSDGFTSAPSNITAISPPSGGTVTTSGVYRIHTFNSSGTFTNTIPSLSVEFLVIAGGGSGGGYYYGGGGGAGGYRCSVSGETSGGGASAESALSLSAGNTTVTIGAGGSSVSGQGTFGNTGSDSTFGAITSSGGGGGASANNTGLSGGSGGGGGGFGASDGIGGSGTTGQGFDGGDSDYTFGGGGGGGAGGAGIRLTSSASLQSGGAGQSSSINGSSTTRAGGGAGAHNANEQIPGRIFLGGSGGGGNGGAYNVAGATAGAVNTGSGGGGAQHANSAPTSGAGGSGVVIIRYQL